MPPPVSPFGRWPPGSRDRAASSSPGIRCAPHSAQNVGIVPTCLSSEKALWVRVRVVGEGGSSGAGRGLSGLTGQLVLVWGAWALARRCGDLRMVEAFHTGLWGLGLILQAGGGDSKIRFNLNERGPASEWALPMRDELCPWNLAVPEMERDSCPWRLSSAPACRGAPAVLSAHCSAVTGQPLSSLAHLGPRRTVLPPPLGSCPLFVGRGYGRGFFLRRPACWQENAPFAHCLFAVLLPERRQRRVCPQ